MTGERGESVCMRERKKKMNEYKKGKRLGEKEKKRNKMKRNGMKWKGKSLNGNGGGCWIRDVISS